MALCCNLPGLPQKNCIQLSSSHLFMQICGALFLASGGFHDIKTLPCEDSASEEQSKPSRDSAPHRSHRVCRGASCQQHILGTPLLGVKTKSGNTEGDAAQSDCRHLQRSRSWVWTVMADLASTDGQVLTVFTDYLQGTGKKGDVILGVTIRTESNSFTVVCTL